MMCPDNAHDDADDQTKGKTAKQGSAERPWKMSGFIFSVSSGIVFVVLFSVATLYHMQGRYALARNWGVAALFVAGVAIIAAYQYYVVAPAEAVEPVVNTPPDRPWLAIDIAPEGDISFTANGSASFPLKVAVNNSGRMPANKARLTAEVICPKFGNEFLMAPIKRRDEICDEAIREAIRHSAGPFDFGTIFPAKNAELFITFQVDASTMAAQAESLPDFQSERFIGPYVVGCTTYTFTVNGHEFTGQTGFVYEILRTVPNKSVTRLIQIGDTVPQNEVVIRKATINGDFAK